MRWPSAQARLPERQRHHGGSTGREVAQQHPGLRDPVGAVWPVRLRRRQRAPNEVVQWRDQVGTPRKAASVKKTAKVDTLVKLNVGIVIIIPPIMMMNY